MRSKSVVSTVYCESCSFSACLPLCTFACTHPLLFCSHSLWTAQTQLPEATKRFPLSFGCHTVQLKQRSRVCQEQALREQRQQMSDSDLLISCMAWHPRPRMLSVAHKYLLIKPKLACSGNICPARMLQLLAQASLKVACIILHISLTGTSSHPRLHNQHSKLHLPCRSMHPVWTMLCVSRSSSSSSILVMAALPTHRQWWAG